jgi:uncharacterized protein (DUF2236 family)
VAPATLLRPSAAVVLDVTSGILEPPLRGSRLLASDDQTTFTSQVVTAVAELLTERLRAL